jgi:hypothetical protein
MRSTLRYGILPYALILMVVAGLVLRSLTLSSAPF